VLLSELVPEQVRVQKNLDRALALLVTDLERRRCAVVSRPRPELGESRPTRHIPAAVRREVWRRDHGRCAVVGTSGRCRETGFLEFHHVEPYATGGLATVANIQLRCRAHNLYEAALAFAEDPGCEGDLGWLILDGWLPENRRTRRRLP
jgi:hypothetical protein